MTKLKLSRKRNNYISLTKRSNYLLFTNKKLEEPKVITSIALKEAEFIYNMCGYNLK